MFYYVCDCGYKAQRNTREEIADIAIAHLNKIHPIPIKGMPHGKVSEK